jgi:hypothetical protein
LQKRTAVVVRQTVNEITMNTPRSIPYDPSLRSVVVFVALGIGIGSVTALPWIQTATFMRAAIGIVVISVVLMARRAYWKRCLIVTDEVIIVPSGFLRLRPRPVSLKGIERVWVTRIFWTDVLRVRTIEGDVEIQDMYLPELKMLWELKAFLEPLAACHGGKQWFAERSISRLCSRRASPILREDSTRSGPSWFVARV